MTICGYFRHQSPNKLVSQLDDPISTKLFMVPGGSRTFIPRTGPVCQGLAEKRAGNSNLIGGTTKEDTV